MKDKEIKDIKKLSQAILAWLSFQMLCGRQAILSESYLAQPITEFFTPLFPNRIDAEWTSPQYKLNARGRPRQLDYVLLSRDSNHPKIAIEAKWTSDSQIDKQRFVDDVMRLEMLRLESNGKIRHTTRLFLLAGLREHTKRCLDTSLNSQGGRIPFFSLFLPTNDFEKHTINIFTSENAIRQRFKDFANAYNVPLLPKSYKTRKVVDEQNEYASVLIWEIQSSRSRTEFNPKTEWEDIVVPITDEDELA
jgi:hypothetical protein